MSKTKRKGMFIETLPSRKHLIYRKSRKKVLLKDVVWRILEKEKAVSIGELTQNLWDSDVERIAKNIRNFRRGITKTLKVFFAKGKIIRLNFRTEKGFIYGLTREDCWNYIFAKELMPERLIKNFMYLIGSQGFVTNVELKGLGFNTWQINKWIERKLGKEGDYIKIHKVNRELKIYYLPRYAGQLELYLRSDQFKEIYDKYCSEKEGIQSLGSNLEKIVGELLKKMDYNYFKQHPIFENDGKEKKHLFMILDGLAFKEDGFPQRRILIECKNWSKPISISLLWRLEHVRNRHFKGKGDIWVFALNGAYKSVWEYIRQKPYIELINKKKLKELCEKYGVNYEFIHKRKELRIQG